jgi:hypothetical protein
MKYTHYCMHALKRDKFNHVEKYCGKVAVKEVKVKDSEGKTATMWRCEEHKR